MSANYTNRKIGFFILMASIHVITAVIFYQYVQTNDADTKLYYFDEYGLYYLKFSLGTSFLIYFVQWLREAIGGTYLDYFLLFQALGFWGIALLVRTLEELIEVLDQTWQPIFTVMMFLPGMYFWTSAIGKDSPLFFACTLALWSTMAISRRWFWFGLAIAIMAMFRLHVAIVAVAALALAVSTGKGISVWLRIVLLLAMIPGIYALADTIQATLQLDISSVGSVANYIETQTNSLVAAAGENGALAALSPQAKVVSLLYRPFFIDSGGLFGLVASFQNVFMLYATYVLIRENRTWRAMFRLSLPIRFATVFLFAMITMLTIMYYNVGLGLRQREMFTPALLLIFAALYLMRSRQRFEGVPPSAGIYAPTLVPNAVP
jgi:hypothetical protein